MLSNFLILASRGNLHLHFSRSSTPNRKFSSLSTSLFLSSTRSSSLNYSFSFSVSRQFSQTGRFKRKENSASSSGSHQSSDIPVDSNTSPLHQQPSPPTSLTAADINNAIIPAKPVDSLTSVDLLKNARVEGNECQMIDIKLMPGQSFRATTSALVYMSDGIEMETSLGGGVGSAARRYLTGENVMVTDFVNKGNSPANVGLSPEYPAKVVSIHLAEFGGSIIAQRGAFLCGNSTVQIQMEFTRSLTAGLFGGGGFVLQRLTGEGRGEGQTVIVKGGGAIIRRELKHDEVVKATAGAVMAFAPTVRYDVQMVSGVKNILFSGEGLFMVELKGPGTIWLQSLPFDKVMEEIIARIPSVGVGVGIPLSAAGVGGSLVPQQGYYGGGGMMEGVGQSLAAGAAMGVASGVVGHAIDGTLGSRAAGGNMSASPSSSSTATGSASSTGATIDPYSPTPSATPSDNQIPTSEWINDPQDVTMREDLPVEEVDRGGGGGGGWFSGRGSDEDVDGEDDEGWGGDDD